MLKMFGIFRRKREFKPDSPEKAIFQKKYLHFQKLLDGNNSALELITELEEVCYGPKPFNLNWVVSRAERLRNHVCNVAEELDALSGGKYSSLAGAVERIGRDVFADLTQKRNIEKTSLTRPLNQITLNDVSEVGGKAARIGEIANRVGLPVPGGFAVTGYAYHNFMKSNGLYREAKRVLSDLELNNTSSLLRCSTEIQEIILNSPLPSELEDSLLREMDLLIDEGGPGTRVAVRSSAASEDSEASFAGQYSSLLGVGRDGLLQAYKTVVASTYNPRAIFYRCSRGYPDLCVVMSVLCLTMIDADSSGVLYTIDPNDFGRRMMLINAVRGLSRAVDGSVPTDFYEVEREGNNLLSTRTALKETRLVVGPHGELIEEPLPSDVRLAPCLGKAEIETLVKSGLVLEQHFGNPQDIEWAMDKGGRIFIVQSRPLNGGTGSKREDEPADDAKGSGEDIAGHSVILRAGTTASRGKACGTAFVLGSEKDIVDIPDGSILVAKQTSTQYVALLGKIRAIVANVGNVTGHMASVSRELGVPTLVETGNATEIIPHGEVVTVDATNRVVYQGRVDSILERKTEVNPIMGTPAYNAAQSALKKIASLNMLDPESDTFTPENCLTFHDVIRFAHEMSMREMFRISDDVELSRKSAVRIRVPLPMRILAVDLGGGLHLQRGESEATTDSILSQLFQALLAGMSDPNVGWAVPVEDRGDDDPIISEAMEREQLLAERAVGPSYAVVSEGYLNFNSRIGHHLAVLDAYCGEHVNDNYLLFSFKGGAPDPERRSRRAALIANVLEQLGFKVSLKGHFVRGELKKYGCTVLREKVKMIGRLLAAVRLLDVSPSDTGPVDWYVEQFMTRNYTFRREHS